MVTKTLEGRVIYNMADGITGGYMGITYISASFLIQDFACVAIGHDRITLHTAQK
jgi:hypothetical protein